MYVRSMEHSTVKPVLRGHAAKRPPCDLTPIAYAANSVLQ